jgi:hypothetical protein
VSHLKAGHNLSPSLSPTGEQPGCGPYLAATRRMKTSAFLNLQDRRDSLQNKAGFIQRLCLWL